MPYCAVRPFAVKRSVVEPATPVESGCHTRGLTTLLSTRGAFHAHFTTPDSGLCESKRMTALAGERFQCAQQRHINQSRDLVAALDEAIAARA